MTIIRVGLGEAADREVRAVRGIGIDLNFAQTNYQICGHWLVSTLASDSRRLSSALARKHSRNLSANKA